MARAWFLSMGFTTASLASAAIVSPSPPLNFSLTILAGHPRGGTRLLTKHGGHRIARGLGGRSGLGATVGHGFHKGTEVRDDPILAHP